MPQTDYDLECIPLNGYPLTVESIQVLLKIGRCVSILLFGFSLENQRNKTILRF